MSRKNNKEFDEIKAGFDKEISKDIEKSKTPWHFINLHTYLQKIKMFLLIDIFAYVPILLIFTYFLIMWHVKV